jgi:hypothetical protein
MIYLTLNGLSGPSIYQDIVAALGLDVVADNSVAQYLRKTHHFASSGAAASVDIFMVTNNADIAILSTLGETQFASVRQLSRLTHLSKRQSPGA